MRNALLTFTCALGALAAAAVLVFRQTGSTTAPDVRIAFLGFTNGAGRFQDARFQVVNRGTGPIRVLKVSISLGEGFDSFPLPPAFLSKPITLQPGAYQEFRTPFFPV